MLASIHPLGERARNNRYLRTAAAFVAGSTVGGLALGAIAGGLGAVLQLDELSAPARAGIVAAAAACAALVDATLGRRGRSLGPRRQVDERWLDRYRGWVYGAGFGVQLGAGLTTTITTAAVWLTAGLALLTGSFPAALAIGAVFGAARGLTLLAGAGVREPEALHRLHGRIANGARAANSAVVATQLGVVVFALVLL